MTCGGVSAAITRQWMYSQLTYRQISMIVCGRNECPERDLIGNWVQHLGCPRNCQRRVRIVTTGCQLSGKVMH